MRSWLSVAVLAALSGCGGTATTDGEESAQDVRATVGEPCGGGTAHAPVCGHGLVCEFSHSPPRPGEHGVCRPVPHCVDTVLCIRGDHWDSTRCRCEPDATDAGTHVCIDTVACIRGDHWDSTACRCVPDTTEACTAPADCHGALPRLCEVCPNGHTECAHFACVSHQCTTRVCD